MCNKKLKRLLCIVEVAVIYLITFGLFSCSSTPPAPTASWYKIYQTHPNLEPITIKYNIKDGLAFAFIETWAVQKLGKGKDSILVNDSTNGLLAGKDDFLERELSYGGGWSLHIYMDYKIVVANGTAVLSLSSIYINGERYERSRQLADDSAKRFLVNRVHEVTESFSKIFD